MARLRTAMESLANGVGPRFSGVGTKGATGNGPALKTSPIGIYAFKHGVYEEGLEFAKEVGRMTHLNPASVASGIVQAHAIYSLLEGISEVDFLRECEDVARKFEEYRGTDFEYLLPRLNFIASNPEIVDAQMQKAIGNRFKVTESYPFALFMFQKYWNEPVEGLIRAVSMGGDADSVGAIYGALAGARGIEMPEDWIKLLKDKEELVTTSQDLVV